MVSILILATGLAGCGDKDTTPPDLSDKPGSSATISMTGPVRWYSQIQIDRGNRLFQTHCAECHKADASGTQEWRKPLANGKYPPPPLNGTAHTWHHSLSVLRQTVRVGGLHLGGSMPGFADKLSDEQIDDILAWVQSQWPDEIYRIWHARNTQTESQLHSIKKGA